MTKKKLTRFEENKTFNNLFQYNYEELDKNGFPLKGKWNSHYFKNNCPISLELGCGKGEYTVGLAERYTEQNFIGIDIKGARLWKGCKTAIEKKLNNVAFIRTRINLLNYFFGEKEVEEIWITFPDPQPQKSRERKRLTSPNFLQLYKTIVKDGGKIHLKTDSKAFFNFTLETIKKNNYHLMTNITDIYSSDLNNEVTSIQTFYEKIWLEEKIPINYLKFSFNHES